MIRLRGVNLDPFGLINVRNFIESIHYNTLPKRKKKSWSTITASKLKEQHKASAAAADGKSFQSIFNDKLVFKIGFKAIKFSKSIQQMPEQSPSNSYQRFSKSSNTSQVSQLDSSIQSVERKKQQTITAYLFCAITRFHGLMRVHCKKLRSVRQARTYIYVPIQVSKWKYLFKHQVFVFFSILFFNPTRYRLRCFHIYMFVLPNTQ